MKLLFILLLAVSCQTTQSVTIEQPIKEVKVVNVKPYEPRLPYQKPIKRMPQPDPFDTPSCMDNAVSFWEQIYTSTGSNTFVYNDKDHTIYLVHEETSWKNRKSTAKRLVNQVIYKTKGDKDDIKAQIGAARTFAIGLDRAKDYIPRIKAKLRAAGVPEALAFIPLVESSFNLKARSKVGALGAWQIMPRTLKLYVKANKKKLYDIDFATDVAILILKHNYELLGSWPLAVNAYHSGPGRLMKAVDNLGTSDMCVITQTYEGKGYKTASRNYFAQFLAARNLYYKSLQQNLAQGK